jgi:signal peptidase II
VSSAHVPASRYVAFLLIAATGALTDLLTKSWSFAWRGDPGERPIWWVIEGYFGIETAVNTGAVFGIGAGQGVLFAMLSVVALVGICAWLFLYGAAHLWWLTIALAMICGGILGNLYDRLGFWWEPGMDERWRTGAVRDWILWQAGDRWKWPNFNIADSLLVTGAAMLIWRSFFPGPEEKVPAADAPPENEDSPHG